jgi:acyl carrier protein
LIESHLSSWLAKVLGYTQMKLDTRQPLNRLGIDSLMAVELRNAIEIDFGIVIPVTSFLQGINLNQLAQQIYDRLASEDSSASSDVGEPKNASMQAKVSQLSDQEVDALLDKLLTWQVSEGDLTQA